MKLKKQDIQLIEKAKSLVGQKRISGGVIKEVGAALLTKKGNIYTGVSLDLACGIGFCAEHSAIANMISHSNETEIKTIVACSDSKVKPIIPPCGRCRELLQLINKKNRNNTYIIISNKEKIKLKELLPLRWM